MDLAELMELYIVKLLLKLLLLHIVISEITDIKLMVNLALLHLNIPLSILELLVFGINEGHKVSIDLLIPHLDELLSCLVFFPEGVQLEVIQFVGCFILRLFRRVLVSLRLVVVVQLVGGLVPNHWVQRRLARVAALDFTFFCQVVVINYLFICMRLVLVVDPVDDGRDLLVLSQAFTFFLKDVYELVHIFSYNVVLII